MVKTSTPQQLVTTCMATHTHGSHPTWNIILYLKGTWMIWNYCLIENAPMGNLYVSYQYMNKANYSTRALHACIYEACWEYTQHTDLYNSLASSNGWHATVQLYLAHTVFINLTSIMKKLATSCCRCHWHINLLIFVVLSSRLIFIIIVSSSA